MRKSDLWLPRFHPKQELAFNSIANEILYGGATRGGKSHWVKICYVLWASHVPNLQLDIFRLTLDDCIAECMEGRYSFPDLLGPWEKDKLVKITQREINFWNGARISLEHARRVEDVKQKHQGIAKQCRAFIEATQISTEVIRWLRGWCTVTEEMREILPECLKDLYPQLTAEQLRNFFPKILYATNPIGQSAGYFRKHFVNARPRLEIGRAERIDGGFARQYVPALVEDNPSEDKDATINRITGMGDLAVADALLNENWDSPVGDFFRQYDDITHTVEDFEPPEHWFKYRAFDWGGHDPACILWIAVASDDEITDCYGKRRRFPRGSLVVYREWYIHLPGFPDKGVGMRNEDIAKGIKERTPEATSNLTLSDSIPFQDRGFARNGKMWKMADDFADAGVPLTMANTDRTFGSKQIIDRLLGKDDFPLLYIARSCQYLREYLPSVPRDTKKPNCYVEDGEATHAVDALRYGCAARPLIKDAPPDPAHYAKPSPMTVDKIVANIQQKNRHAYR